MSVFGNPAEWSDLLDTMVPDILRLAVAAWESLPPIAADTKEDDITLTLYRALQQNRDARELPLQIRLQQVEPNPAPNEDMGRMDIAFNLLVPSEDMYFCLEGKRLNAVKNGVTRPYASEYVTLGMMRLVTGKYARAVRHGGMIGYVLDRDVTSAITNVEANVRAHHAALGMVSPGELQDSEVLKADARARESRHDRQHDAVRRSFRIHHLFMAIN